MQSLKRRIKLIGNVFLKGVRFFPRMLDYYKCLSFVNPSIMVISLIFMC